MIVDTTASSGIREAAGGYGPPGGGGYGGPPGGGFGGPPPGGGGGYGGPPPGGGGYGGPPGGSPPGGSPPGGFGGPPPGFGPPGGFPPPGGPMMPGAGGDVNTTLPLVLSVLSLVLCCNVLFGGLGLFFAIQAGNAKKAGDVETARSKAKVAMIIVIVGTVLEALGVGARVIGELMR